MSTAAPQPPAPKPAPRPATQLAPPDEEFWDKYSAHAEFPISTVATVFLHVAIGAVLIVILTQLMNRGDDKSSVPIKLVEVTGGDDKSGDGSAGSGGIADPIARAEANPLEAIAKNLPDPKMLPKVVEDVKKEIQTEDPNANLPVAAQNAAAFATIDKKVRDSMLGLGGKKGDGPGDGSGFSGEKGKGPGGKGASSTLARSCRWVLRFKISSAADYLDQLATLGAIIVVPTPPQNDPCVLFSDLRNPRQRKTVSLADLSVYSDQFKFSEAREGVKSSLATALGLGSDPPSLWVIMPKKFEDELARKERNYRNRREEDIEETVFQMVIRGGTYDILVYDQIPKR